MRKDREKAISLRRFGKSYKEIKEELGMSKSTLHEWLKNHTWSREIKENLIKKANKKSSVRIKYLDKIRKKHLNSLYREAKKEAKVEFGILRRHPLFLSGLLIYWGEGDKTSKYNTRISNTDPYMIKLFRFFLLNVCGVNPLKIKIWILLYPDINEKTCKKFWIKKTGLSAENFTKSIVIKGRHKKRKVSFGVGNIGVSSRYLKEKMLVWLEMLPDYLIKKHCTRE